MKEMNTEIKQNNNNTEHISRTLLMIASCALLLAGCLFLGISIFSETESNWYLVAALGSICMANLFNIVRSRIRMY